MMEFKDKLKTLRQAKGLSRDELADSINISSITLANYERGKHEPTAKVAIDLAKVLEVTVEELFCEEV